jgi:cobalt-zinc-cadmium efflux system outer membrane protein
MGMQHAWVCRALASVAVLAALAEPARGQAPAPPAQPYTLEAILDLAEKQNPSLAVFLANVEASRGEAVTARVYPNPTTNLARGRGESLGVSPDLSGNEYQATVVQPLEWPLKREFRIQAAQSKVEAARLDAEGFRLFLRAEVKEAFYQVLLAEKQVELALRNLETVRDLRRSVEIRVQTGEAPAFELVKADVELLKAQNEVARRRSQVDLARASLNALLGSALPKSFTVAGQFSSTKTWPDLPVLIERALDTHPTVIRQRREVERWRYQLDFERQARVPDVGLGGMYIRDIDKKAFGVVLSVPIPLWDRRRGQIATAMAEGRRAEADLERSRTELTKAITQEYQNYRIAAEQLTVFETGLLKQAEEALRIAQISFRQGASGLLDLLDAQRVQRATLQEYYGALYDLSAAQAQLERVTGLGEF